VDNVRHVIAFPKVPDIFDEDQKDFLREVFGVIQTILAETSRVQGDLDIGGVIYFLEGSKDPTEPKPGQSVIWLSDGTGKGDDGDVMIGTNVDGTTKYGTLFDYSGGAGW